MSDDEIPITTARTCSVCHQTGHRAPHCPMAEAATADLSVYAQQAIHDLQTMHDLALDMTGGHHPEDADMERAAIERVRKRFGLKSR